MGGDAFAPHRTGAERAIVTPVGSSSGEARSPAGSERAWTWFRTRPWWAQALGWVLLWPILAGLFFWRWPRVNPRLGKPLAVGILVLGSTLYYLPLANDASAPTSGESNERPESRRRGSLASPKPSPSLLASPTLLLSPDGSPAGEPSQAPTSFRPGSAIGVLAASVTRIIDGDTVDVRLESGKGDRVRFIGVDTPERGRPYSSEATSYTSKNLAGASIFLELDVEQRDRYGRLLAYVWLAQPSSGSEAEVRTAMHNARLLLDGFAQLLTVPPNVRYVDMFKRFQQEAREASRGLWGAQAEPTSSNGCHPSYPDVCIPPPPPDLDCPEISHRNFRVLWNVPDPDPHGFDRDKDGVGCET